MLKISVENTLSEATIEALESLYHFQKELGARDRLLIHHGMVLDSALRIIYGLPDEIRNQLNIKNLLSGVYLHDVGKIIISEDIFYPGQDHEDAGYLLLLLSGFPKEIAGYCISGKVNSIEKAISVLADRIWTGVRDFSVEEKLVRMISEELEWDFWDTFKSLDGLFDKVAIESFQNYKSYIELFSTN